MPDLTPMSPALIPVINTELDNRVSISATEYNGSVTSTTGFREWLAAARSRNQMHVVLAPLAALDGWHIDRATGNIGHRNGRFFTVEGVDVRLPGRPVEHWNQPIINQPEIGVLGILVKEFDGVLHCLMQAKAEPGNCNGVQLSPTIQATRSNYTRVHQGRAVPYLEYFHEPRPTRHVIADVCQSEQGSWFYHKRNRNMIVEITEDIDVLPDFCWLTLGQIHRLLQVTNMVNMDARTVLSCLPFTGPTSSSSPHPSSPEDHGSLHSTTRILSWITDVRSRQELMVERVPLKDITRWRRTDERIDHQSGLFFSVIGVAVDARQREVDSWMQPMFQPHGIGVIAFLVRWINDRLHVLVHAGIEPGHRDVVELGPTVQCTPANYANLPHSARPPFLDHVLRAPRRQVLYDTVLSEEGGRFHYARNRYMIIETDLVAAPDEFPDFRWVSVDQLVGLLRHSHYVNIQARSLLACLHSLLAPMPATKERA